MCTKKRGFTLIELLVIITVIALLIAVFLPVLKTARDNAKAVMCGANIKQLLLALTSYETQNGTFPYGINSDLQKGMPPGGYTGDSSADKRGWWWFHFIKDYAGKSFDRKSVFWCPSRDIKDAKIRTNLLCANYGVNHVICKDFKGNTSKTPDLVGTPLRINQILQPARTFLLIDSGYSTITWWYATDTPPFSITGNTFDDSAYVPGLWPKNRGNPRPGTEYDALNSRHLKRSVNTGFVDGHITRQKADDFRVEKVGNDYRNRSPLWLPKEP